MNIYQYFRSPSNRYYNLYAYYAVIKEVKQSHYNILIEIFNHKLRTLRNVIRNDTGKVQRAKKMATYSPNVSNSLGSRRIMKIIAWFRHSSSDVLPDLRFFLFFGDDAGMGAAASAPSPEFSANSSASTGTTWNDKMKTGDLKCLFLKYLILNKVYFFSVTMNRRRMAEM